MPHSSSTETDRSTALRERMVDRQIAARGIRDPLVLAAMRRVPREVFLSESLADLAYQDTPLPIESDQTISQPYIVAYMTERLGLRGGERVLEVGTGSGYAGAVLAEIAASVYTVERYANLADSARRRLARLGYRNVEVRHGDGSTGWAEHAPYDAIVVAAGGPEVPEPLLQQLRVGGRLVMPIGGQPRGQHLVRITRVGEAEYQHETLLDVQFVPLIGAAGWAEPVDARPPREVDRRQSPATLIAGAAEPFEDIEQARLEALLARIGDSRIVLLGEASHGTSEFYRMRARITRELIERKGFSTIAVEADWPDAARIDHDIRDLDSPARDWVAFARFPTWMWRNEEVRVLVAWLRDHNSGRPADRRVSFHGLDLYSLHTSIAAILAFLDDADPATAALARHRYGRLSPWESDPAAYGHAVLTDRYRSCEAAATRMLRDLLQRRLELGAGHSESYFDAVQNARVVVGAERYYREMYYGGPTSWNLRDSHMAEILDQLLRARSGSKVIVWAHNSHLGDARATEMSARGEHNLGQLCRTRYGSAVYSIGFGTDHGEVAAASNWGDPMERKRVRPSHERSYERQCHLGGVPRFLLDLRTDRAVREALMEPRLERAIGVIYRPETELASHYFAAHLPRQFDEWIWFDETSAVRPLASEVAVGVPDTYPFGL